MGERCAGARGTTKGRARAARDAERENVRDWLDEIEESSVRDHVARTQAKGARSNEIQHLADVVQVFLQSVHVAKRSQSGGSKLPTSMSHLTLGTDDRENASDSPVVCGSRGSHST